MSEKVIYGEVFGVKGTIVARTPTYYLDSHFYEKDTVYEHRNPKGWNSMLVIYQGSTKVQDKT